MVSPLCGLERVYERVERLAMRWDMQQPHSDPPLHERFMEPLVPLRRDGARRRWQRWGKFEWRRRVWDVVP